MNKERKRRRWRKSKRITVITVFIFGIFAFMWASVYRIQILDADLYRELAAENTYEEQTTSGIRGCIYDRYGRPLAINTESLSLYYLPDANHPDLNEALVYLLDILETNGDSISLEQTFPIGYDEKTGFYYLPEYDVGSNEVALYNFLAEIYNTSRDALTYEQKMTTAEEAFNQLVQNTFELPQMDSVEKQLELAQIRYAIFCGRFNPTVPVLIADNISETTQAAIMERRSDFNGFTVQTEYTREYPEGELFAHIVGYAGHINQTELEEHADQGYDANDTIGKTGVELYYEEQLRGVDGTVQIELDGDTGDRVNETILEPATQGNSIFLTIDRDLQEQAYEALYAQIKNLLLSKITGQSSSTGETYSLTDLYCALIDNNFVSIQTIEGSQGEYASAFRQTYEAQSEYLLAQLEESILNSNLIFSQYSEILQDIYNQMIESMRDNEHLTYDYQNDTEFYSEYSQGNLTIRSFLEYCLNQGYIHRDIYGLEEETNLDVILQTIIEQEFDNLRRSNDYKKCMYRYIIENQLYSESSFLYLMYEEELIHNQDGSREAVASGNMSILNCLIQKIEEDEITPADLNLDPCSGSAVLTDCNTGEVLAMVSYPSFDPNRFLSDTAYYNEIVQDNSGPLTFRALNEMRAIGSTYKMCTAIAGLDLGYIDEYTTVYDDYAYPYVNSVDHPTCWSTVSHGVVNVVTALEHSCNYFFYDVGYRLSDPTADHEFDDDVGLKKLADYAERLGLSTQTGIEIGEGTPKASDQDAVRSAIGQGTNAFSAANVNRYTCTVANGGSVYNLFLIDEIHSADGALLYQTEPVKASDTGISESIFSIVKEGMRLVVTEEHAAEFASLEAAGIHTAGKTGTAQEAKDRPDHSFFTGYASYENPEIVATVVIPYGGGSANAIPVFRDIIANYYGISLDTEQDM